MFFKLLRTKLIVQIIFIVATVTAISLYIVYQYNQKTLERHLSYDAKIFTEIIEDALINSMQNHEGNKAIERILPIFSNLEHVQKIRILDNHAAVRLSTIQQENNKLIEDRQLTKFLNSPAESHFIQTSKGNNTSFLKWRKISNATECQTCHSKSEKYLGVLWVQTSDVVSFDILRSNITLFAGLSFLIILLLSVVTLSFFTRSLDRPMKEFTNTIKAVEQGDFSSRIRRTGEDEIGQLGQRLNTLFERLEKAKNHLLDMHQQELLQAEIRAKMGQQAASLAHEIKNPIAGIVFAVNSILREMDPSDKKRGIFEEIVKQANNVEKYLETLLSYIHQRRIRCVPTDLNDLIQNLLLLFRERPETKNIIIKLDLAADLQDIMVDTKQIEQVLVNLILNAIQAIPEKGNLTIRTRYIPEKDTVRITIEDTGTGIPEVLQNSIFQPFFTTKQKGTGLGLTFCEDVVLRHGGTISFESKPGFGTVFFIELPVESVEPIPRTVIEKNYTV